MGETLILGLRQKGITLRALMWVVTSLWPQKVVCRSHIYSARATLMHNYFWPDQRRPASTCPFQNGLSTFGILNKSTVSCDDLCGEGESYWARVIWWYLVHIMCGNIVPGWLRIFLSVSQTWLMVWFPEVVDRQNSGMSWCSCSKIIMHKHKNVSWVFSWRDFVLDNRFWAQERWILGLL